MRALSHLQSRHIFMADKGGYYDIKDAVPQMAGLEIPLTGALHVYARRCHP